MHVHLSFWEYRHILCVFPTYWLGRLSDRKQFWIDNIVLSKSHSFSAVTAMALQVRSKQGTSPPRGPGY